MDPGSAVGAAGDRLIGMRSEEEGVRKVAM
jgi:hypothetical protein